MNALEKIVTVAKIAINKRPSSLLKISTKEQASCKYVAESKKDARKKLSRAREEEDIPENEEKTMNI